MKVTFEDQHGNQLPIDATPADNCAYVSGVGPGPVVQRTTVTDDELVVTLTV